MTDSVPEEQTLCPIARSTEIAGDRWTILILRELFAGCARFDDIQAQTGATAQMMAGRLRRMERDGLITRRVYEKRPLRHEYLLTDKGRDYHPVILALRSFGERWCKRADEPKAIRLFHECGGEVGLDGICIGCREVVNLSDATAHPTPEYMDERRKRMQAFKARNK